MKIEREQSGGRNAFTGYGTGYVEVSGTRYSESLVVSADRIVADWPAQSVQTGFALYDRDEEGAESPGGLAHFLDAGRMPDEAQCAIIERGRDRLGRSCQTRAKIPRIKFALHGAPTARTGISDLSLETMISTRRLSWRLPALSLLATG